MKQALKQFDHGTSLFQGLAYWPRNTPMFSWSSSPFPEAFPIGVLNLVSHHFRRGQGKQCQRNVNRTVARGKSQTI